MSPMRLAWLNLSRHRAATLLTLAALALVVAIGGILLRAWHVADSRFASVVRAGDAILGAKADPVDMTLSALNLEGPYPGFIPLRFATLLNNNWVEKDFSVHITPILFCGKYKGRRVIGTTPNFLTQPKPSPDLALASGFWPEEAPGVVLGAEAARRENLGLGDTIPVLPWTSDSIGVVRPATLMQVTGILKPMGNAWDGALFTNIIQAEMLLGRLDPATWNGDWSALVLHYLILHVPAGGLDHVRAVVNERTVAQVASIPEAMRTLERLTATGRALGVAVALLALCLAAVAIAGLMLGRFEGLGRQMATLEAIGYERPALLAVLAWEGFLLGAGALITGGLVDALLFPVFRKFLAGTLPSPEAVASSPWESWPVWALVLPFMVLLSVLSSLFIFRGRPGERLRGLA